MQLSGTANSCSTRGEELPESREECDDAVCGPACLGLVIDLEHSTIRESVASIDHGRQGRALPAAGPVQFTPD